MARLSCGDAIEQDDTNFHPRLQGRFADIALRLGTPGTRVHLVVVSTGASHLAHHGDTVLQDFLKELNGGGRSLLLQGGTLLHVAAEYGNVAATALLLDRGADVNARATLDEAGVGGQTAIFHAVTQFDDYGLPVTQLLLERGADLSLRVKLPGDYERPGEIVQCTPMGYALRFGGESQRRTIALLRERGAVGWSKRPAGHWKSRARTDPMPGSSATRRLKNLQFDSVCELCARFPSILRFVRLAI